MTGSSGTTIAAPPPSRPGEEWRFSFRTASPARPATRDSRFRGPPPGRAGRSPSPRSTTTDSAAAPARRPSGTSRSPLLTCTTDDSRRWKRSSTTMRRAEPPRPAGALSSAASVSPKPRSAISSSSWRARPTRNASGTPRSRALSTERPQGPSARVGQDESGSAEAHRGARTEARERIGLRQELGQDFAPVGDDRAGGDGERLTLLDLESGRLGRDGEGHGSAARKLQERRRRAVARVRRHVGAARERAFEREEPLGMNRKRLARERLEPWHAARIRHEQDALSDRKSTR